MKLGEGELKDKLNLSLVTEIENKGKETGLGAKWEMLFSTSSFEPPMSHLGESS